MIGAGGRSGPVRSPYGSIARTKRRAAATELAAAAARVAEKRRHRHPAASSSREPASLTDTATPLPFALSRHLRPKAQPWPAAFLDAFPSTHTELSTELR